MERHPDAECLDVDSDVNQINYAIDINDDGSLDIGYSGDYSTCADVVGWEFPDYINDSTVCFISHCLAGGSEEPGALQLSSPEGLMACLSFSFSLSSSSHDGLHLPAHNKDPDYDYISPLITCIHGLERSPAAHAATPPCCRVKDLQSLAGHLSHASTVVRGGRTFSRRVNNLLMFLDSDTNVCVLPDWFKDDMD